jgi:uncharacterized protein
MPFDIILGRTKKEIDKLGKAGAIFLGKQYVTMGAVISLSNNVFLDVAQSHIVFVAGKRGGGKSYSLGVIAEGVAKLPIEVKQNLSIILLDTMGVFWTMKYPNHQDTALLEEWKMEAEGLDVKIFTPAGFYDKYKEKGIPTDAPFALKPSDLEPEDWCLTFGLDQNSPAGVLIARVVQSLKGSNFGIIEMIKATQKDDKSDDHTKNVVVGRLQRVQGWGIFSKQGTPLKDLAKAGQVTVLDMSAYATLPSGWLIKALVTGLVSKKLFNQRMIARKNEEFTQKLDQPLVGLVIDEAHEFLPHEGKTTASDALITILREGRQPGISLILATQQPGKIHTDVITQSDIVISHRLTAQVDVEALGKLTQSYMREGLTQKLDSLPRVKGAAVVFDDKNERIFAIKVRPRITWHGGSAPTAVIERKDIFSKSMLSDEL